MRRYPHLYEINTRVFLGRLSREQGRSLTLATIPGETWQSFANRGLDLIWLMGVWQRSPAARHEALTYPGLSREYDRALPDWTEKDVEGSPYAIYDYRLDSALGSPDELARTKYRLNRSGMGLVLDFVPNHLARDHSWISSHPERFVQGTEADIRLHPDWFFSPSKGVYLAHGRDPYFPPWSDTVQVNFYSSDMRKALIDRLLKIAAVADGVRCDMSMLALNDVFKHVWGEVIKDPPPKTEFWEEAISQVKKKYPGFIFLAEAYWELERKLQQVGFDFTYDKLLYDKLRLSLPHDIREHLCINDQYYGHSIHFTENHDEPRAISAFGLERSLAAAVISATIPGMRLFHDGQFEGRRIHLPIQLIREPAEEVDAQVADFYKRLLAIINDKIFHEGEWRLGELSQAGEGNRSHNNLLACFWLDGLRLKIVAVNYSPAPAQGWLKLPVPVGGTTALRDELNGVTYMREARELNKRGLYIALEPYKAHIFSMAI